jgi:hypothetical protein
MSELIPRTQKPNQCPPTRSDGSWVTYGLVEHRFVFGAGSCPDSSIRAFYAKARVRAPQPIGQLVDHHG